MADTTGPFRDVLPLPDPTSDTVAERSGLMADPSDPFGVTFASRAASSMPPPAAAPRAPGPRLIGDLEVLGELARGGMGVVYRAMDRRLGREVAIKVLLTGGAADLEELERFAVEARVAARLKHPNIVGIHRVGEDRGAPYMVMDLVPGESLHRRLGRDGPLPLREAARLCALLARALAFAHGRGVLHRDLKPHNVLLTPDGEPILTDFGLAKEVGGGRGRELTVTGQVLGTPAYMAPEQARGDGERIDRRADVYGLGATLYAALTGRPPFQAGSAIAVLSKVVEEQVEPPRRSRPEVDRDLETIVLKCLEKEPAARYDTAHDLADDLQRYLAGEPVRARRLGALARAARWVRRHRLASAGAASALLLSVAVGVGTTLLEQDRLLEQARAAAEQAAAPIASDAPLDARLGHSLARLQAAQRWRDLAGTREARQALVAAAFDLGAVARDGAQWELARHAYRLSGLGDEDPRVAQALDDLEQASTAEARRRRDAVSEALDALVRGDVTDPRETVFALVRYPDASTIEVLCERLRGAIDVLVRARREVLLDAAQPTLAEGRIGLRPLADLPAAVALLEGDGVPPGPVAEEALQVVWEAAQRVARREEATATDPGRVWAAIARAQARALTEGGVRQARACVEALGRIGAATPSPAAEAALRAYVRAELDPVGTGLGQRALGRLGVSLDAREALLDRRIGPAELPMDLRDLLVAAGPSEPDASSDGLERRALALFLRGDVKAALEVLGAGLARSPGDPSLLVRRATLNLDCERLEEALVDAERAVEVAPAAVTLGLRAWVLATMGTVDRARRDLEAAERLGSASMSPQDASYAWLMIGRAHFALGDGPAARSAVTRSLEFNSTQTAASILMAQSLLVERKLEQADAVLARALQIEPTNVYALLTRADLRSLTGDTGGALDDLETVHAVAPTLLGAAEKRAHLLIRLNRLADAADAAEDLLLRDPDHAGARWILAHVALAGRRPDLAEEHCERGLRSGSLPQDDHADLLTALSQARLLLGRPGEALQAADEALRVLPDHPDALVIRAAIRLQLSDPTRALADLDRVIELAPGNAVSYTSRARVHVARGDLAAATRDCEQALAIDAALVEARIILSELLLARGDLAAAEGQLGLALEAEPGVAELKVRRAQVRLRRGDVVGARADLDRALVEAPSMSPAWVLRAELRLSQADRAGAESDLLRAAELEPRDAPTVQALARLLAAVGQVERARAVLDRAIPLQRDGATRARLERQRAELPGRR